MDYFKWTKETFAEKHDVMRRMQLLAKSKNTVLWTAKQRQVINKMPKRILNPELIPHSAWGQSLASFHRQDRCKYWPTIRDEAFTTHGTQCVFCETLPVHGHEVWSFDDKNAVMTLEEVVPICEMCHHVVHLGHAELLAAKGELNFRDVLAHFGKVRGCSKFDLQILVREAFETWDLRSRRPWTVNFGKFSHFIHAPRELPDLHTFDEMPVVKDKDRLPSKTAHVKWLSVRRNPQKLPDSEKTGHLLMSGTYADLDKIWPVAARMTMAHELGSEAYASTAQNRETAGFLRDTGIVGVVLGLDDDKDEIEAILYKVFGKMAKSIRYKGTR